MKRLFFVDGFFKLHYFIYTKVFGSIRYGCFDFQCEPKKQLLVRPGKVVHSNGWDARPGRLASHRVASPWIVGSNPEIKRRTARQQAVNRKAEGIEPRNA